MNRTRSSPFCNGGTLLGRAFRALPVRSFLKLNTKLSFCCEYATKNRPLRTTKSTAELSQAGIEPKQASRRILASSVDRAASGFPGCYRSAVCPFPKAFAPLISSRTLRTPGTRRSQPGLRGGLVCPGKKWRQLCELDLLGESEHLKHPDSVPIHVYLVPA